jgi:hypothetical protein
MNEQGTLSSLAMWTFTTNFKRNSPFADLVPAWGDYLRHPIDSVQQLAHVIRMHEMHNAAKVQTKRQRGVDDVAKRAEYRKAHGLSTEQGLFSSGKKIDEPAKEDVVVKEKEAKAEADIGPVVVALPEESGAVGVPPVTPSEPRKKWLGIF